jgi:DHA3 family tetracycline resistance protein-like MFS transporter
MAGQLDAIGQIAGGPVVGVIGTLVSIRAALVATGALLLPALAFFPPAIRREEDKPRENP